MLEVVVEIIKRKHDRLSSLPSETWASVPDIEMDMILLTVGTQKELKWCVNYFWNVVPTLGQMTPGQLKEVTNNYHMNALFMKVFSRDTIPSLGNIHEIELYVASLNEDMHYHLLELPGDLDSKPTRKHIFDACCPPGAVQLSNEFHGQVTHFAGRDPRIEPSYALLTDFEKVSKIFTFSCAAALRIQALYDFTPNLSKKSEHSFRFTASHLGYQTPGVRTYPNMDDDKSEIPYLRLQRH